MNIIIVNSNNNNIVNSKNNEVRAEAGRAGVQADGRRGRLE